MPRKIIFECAVGSHLYGTNRPESDLDFQGVFIPGTEDLLGMQNCPTEWSQNQKSSEGIRNQAGDVDRKYYSLKRFLELAVAGQPGQLELLFAPDNKIVKATPEWLEILLNKEAILSRKSIGPFVGFAKAQAYKASMKGTTLNLIRRILEVSVGPGLPRLFGPLSNYLTKDALDNWFYMGIAVTVVKNSHGFQLLEIGGRAFDTGSSVKNFISCLTELESRYGSRSRQAAGEGYDWKSLTHAYRLMLEAKQFLRTGKIEFPLTGTDELVGDIQTWLHKVRNGYLKEIDHADYLDILLEQVREAEATSNLPELPDSSKINALCLKMLMQHLNVESD